MSTRKLVSVVTGTYNRHELLLEAIENVRQQTYRPLEHVIVADGPDIDLRRRITGMSLKQNGLRLTADGWPTLVEREDTGYSITFADLGFWSSGLFTDSISAAPFLVAQLMARGEYQITLADDERFLVSDAIAQLVDTLESYQADFVYPRVEMWAAGSTHRFVIGTDPPLSGQFTHWLATREALNRGGLFRTHVGSATDWDCASRMMAAGCRWAFLPEVTLSHRIDK